MTSEELLSIKEFGSNLGYLLNDNFSSKLYFTLRYPECSDYDVVFDSTYNGGVTISISTQTADDIINNYSDYDGNIEEFNYTNTSLETIKTKLKEKWIEYKNYLNGIELNKIGEDFK